MTSGSNLIIIQDASKAAIIIINAGKELMVEIQCFPNFIKLTRMRNFLTELIIPTARAVNKTREKIRLNTSEKLKEARTQMEKDQLGV